MGVNCKKNGRNVLYMVNKSLHYQNLTKPFPYTKKVIFTIYKTQQKKSVKSNFADSTLFFLYIIYIILCLF